jgi:hypothetical protein
VRSVFYHLHERMLFAAFTRLQRRERRLAGNLTIKNIGSLMFSWPLSVSSRMESQEIIDTKLMDSFSFSSIQIPSLKC